MVDILKDTTKFNILGIVDEFSKTAIEKQRIKGLIGFHNDHLLLKNIYEKIRPGWITKILFV